MENSFRDQLEVLIKKIINRETIAYTIAGVLTTLVNFISYEGFYRILNSKHIANANLNINANLTANAIAWFVAVVFAYIVNKINVFQSKSNSFLEEISKIGKFFGARVVTLVIEQLGMYVFAERMGIYRWFVKAALAVFVIIINYIFSKLCIFNEKKTA